MPRFRLRTLMIGVAVAAVCLAGFHGSIGLGAWISFILIPAVVMTYRAAEMAARQGMEFGLLEGLDTFRWTVLFCLFMYPPFGIALYVVLSAFGVRIG